MPDDPIIVDVQGVGPVSFPAGTSGAQIQSWVLNRIAADRRAQAQQEQTWGQWAGNQAARIGGGIVGGVLGSLAGPVGTFAGTATGAAMGDEWAQSREVAQGVRDAVNPLEMVAAGATAPIPGATLGEGSLLRQVPRAFAAGLPGAAASSAGMQYAQTGTVDPWQLATDTGRGAAMGTLMGVGIPAALRGANSKAVGRLLTEERGAIGHPPDDDYRGSHQSPGRDYGAPLHDLTGAGTMYPDDVYGPMAVQYYGTGRASLDRESMAIAHRMKDRPNGSVTVYRAVPKDAPDVINPGDWVSINKRYAMEHGEGPLRGEYKLLSTTAKASDLFTEANSIHEWGWHPAADTPGKTRK